MNTQRPSTSSPSGAASFSLSTLACSGDEPAVFAFGADDIRCWTYAELDRFAGRLAAGLKTAGLTTEDTVAMLALPSPEFMAATLAVLRVGATVIPIDAQFGDEALVHVLEDARPKWLFTDERGGRRLEKLHTEAIPHILQLDLPEGDTSWRSLLAEEALSPEETTADQRAVIFYTSGTTGAPKGVPLTRRNLFYQLDVARESGLIRAGDRMVLPLPLHHVYPFVFGLLAPLHTGLAIILPAALTGPQLARAISERQASIVMGVPRLHRALVDGIRNKAEGGGALVRTLFRVLLKTSQTCCACLGKSPGRILFGSLHRKMGGHLRLMISGGSQLDPRVAAQIEAFGWDLAVGYGLTETSPLLSILHPGDRKFETVGRVVGGTKLKIAPIERAAEDDDEQPDPQHTDSTNQRGEVLARGPGVFKGYHNLPDETAKALDGEWFHTGDVGWFDTEGFLHLEGRVSTMLVLEGGENISPDKLEATYEEACEEIEEIGILQKDGRLVAVIVPREQVVGQEVRDQIGRALQRIRNQIPSYQRLAEFKLSTQELPRTRLGKIRRHKLAELFDRAEEEDPQTAEPVSVDQMPADDQSLLDNPKANALWNLLARRYAEQRLKPESRLETDLGIDSMGWVELSSAIETETGLQFGDEVMQSAETVHDLLEAAVGPTGAGTADSQKAIKDPESVLREGERRWLQPRTALHKTVGWLLYLLHQLVVRIFFPVHLHGRENLPADAPYIITPNHISYLDPSALVSGIRRPLIDSYYWAGLSQTLFRNRFWRGISRLGQVFPIDPQRGPVTSLALGAAVLKRGQSVIWFPEGRRSPDGTLLPFRPGIGLLLQHYPHVPVVPVHIEGTHQALPPGKFLPRPHRINVYIGTPRMPEELEKEGHGETPHQRIANALHDTVKALGDSTPF